MSRWVPTKKEKYGVGTYENLHAPSLARPSSLLSDCTSFWKDCDWKGTRGFVSYFTEYGTFGPLFLNCGNANLVARVFASQFAWNAKQGMSAFCEEEDCGDWELLETRLVVALFPVLWGLRYKLTSL